MFPPQLRIAFKCLVVQRAHRPVLYKRDFSLTPRRQAGEDPDSFISSVQNSPLFRKLADKPEALQALNDFALIVKDSGLELTSSSPPPSTMQMVRLASNAKFREGAKRLIEEMKKAGIDVNPENAFELFTGSKRR